MFKCKVLWMLGILLIINSKEAEAQGAFPATKDVYGEIGESVTLPCSLESEVISHVQWTRGEVHIYSSTLTTNNGFFSAEIAQQFAIVGDRKIEFALKVNSLSATDVPQQFRCSPFGLRGAVIIVKKPNLSVKLSADNEANLVAGQSRVVLTCNATGADPTDVKFEWSQTGDYVPSSLTSPSGTVVSDTFTSTLTLNPLRYSDDAEFTCTVSNGYYKDGKAKALKKTLSVQFPPMEAPDHWGLEKEDNIYVAEGTEVQVFKLPYIANPGTLGGATYEWTKDGSALPAGVRGTSDATHVYLIFDAIKDEFYGDYKLTMTNSVGSNDVTTATLGKPGGKPTIIPVTKGLGAAGVAGVVVAVLVLLSLLVVGVVCYVRRRNTPVFGRSKRARHDYTVPTFIARDMAQETDTIYEALESGEQTYVALAPSLGGKRVMKTSMSLAEGHMEIVKVTLTEPSDDRDRKALVLEGEMRQQLGPHPQIVPFLIMFSDPPLLVLRYAALSDVANRLGREDARRLSPQYLLTVCCQTAQALAFLHSKKIVHRNPQASNVLLNETGDVWLSGFGSVRPIGKQIKGKTEMQKPGTAYAWWAPECFVDHVTDPSTDVWSLGVLVWQVFSAGATPFEGTAGERLHQELRAGKRLPKPSAMPQQLFTLVQEMWAASPQHRPSCNAIVTRMKALVLDSTYDVQLDGVTGGHQSYEDLRGGGGAPAVGTTIDAAYEDMTGAARAVGVGQETLVDVQYQYVKPHSRDGGGDEIIRVYENTDS